MSVNLAFISQQKGRSTLHNLKTLHNLSGSAGNYEATVALNIGLTKVPYQDAFRNIFSDVFIRQTPFDLG